MVSGCCWENISFCVMPQDSTWAALPTPQLVCCDFSYCCKLYCFSYGINHATFIKWIIAVMVWQLWLFLSLEVLLQSAFESAARALPLWMMLTYLGLVLQLEASAAVESALALHSAHNCLACIWGEVDCRHHFMHISPVHHSLIWNVPHAYLHHYHSSWQTLCSLVTSSCTSARSTTLWSWTFDIHTCTINCGHAKHASSLVISCIKSS